MAGVREGSGRKRRVPSLHRVVVGPRAPRLVGVRHGEWGRRVGLGLGSLSALAAVETGPKRPRATDERARLSGRGGDERGSSFGLWGFWKILTRSRYEFKVGISTLDSDFRGFAETDGERAKNAAIIFKV